MRILAGIDDVLSVIVFSLAAWFHIMLVLQFAAVAIACIKLGHLLEIWTERRD